MLKVTISHRAVIQQMTVNWEINTSRQEIPTALWETRGVRNRDGAERVIEVTVGRYR